MKGTTQKSRGFALIAALLIIALFSAISVGLMLRAMTEVKVGGGDLQNNQAYHAAEGQIESMTASLAAYYDSIQAPNASDITALSTSTAPTNTSAMSYPVYSFIPATKANGSLYTNWGQISTGANAGLYAQTIPVTLHVVAQSALGDQVSMYRGVEVALIPVFQYGVFSQFDLGFFNSPNLTFAGRIHTNGDLYVGVSNGSTLTFQDKVEAYGNVVYRYLPNGLNGSSYNDTGTVKLLTAANGCSGSAPNCSTLTAGSVTGNATSSQNASWSTISKSTFNGWIIDGNYGKSGGTGAVCLTLPFTGTGSTGCPTGPGQPPSTTGPQAYEIIRRAQPTDSSSLSAARNYNTAEIRVLISDDPSELPGGAGDAQNIRLANVQTSPTAPDYSHGVPTGVASSSLGTASGKPLSTYFAEASTSILDPTSWPTNGNNTTCLPEDWPTPPVTGSLSDSTGRFTLLNYTALNITSTQAQLPVFPASSGPPAYSAGYPPLIQAGNPYVSSSPTCQTAVPDPSNLTQWPPSTATTWNLIDGYIRVEYRAANATTYTPVTQEWLQLGFARATQPPTSPGSNPVNPNAILLLQEIAQRNINGGATLDLTYTKQSCSGSPSVCTPKYMSKPPDVYIDPNVTGNSTLKLPYYADSGQTTSASRYNWYPINFYDAREGEPRDTQVTATTCNMNGVMNAVELDVGNLKKWLTTSTNGQAVDSATDNGYLLYFSDRRGMLVNPTAGVKTGDSGLEDVINTASTSGVPDKALEGGSGIASPEDDNLNGVLDNYGAKNIGDGFGVNTYTAMNPYGSSRIDCSQVARQVRVSGARHVLKLVDGALGNVPQPGFTVVSENPVYVVGNYNSSSADNWTNPPTTSGDPTTRSNAAIIADAVTLLSNSWNDFNSFLHPAAANGGTFTTSSTSPNSSPNRAASTTYYRVAIAAGKNRDFTAPSYTSNSLLYGFGTDGGVHNFLRFLEDWTYESGGAQSLYYKGSIVSLYFSNYATGTFKCCGDTVYHPPSRQYYFDPEFTIPTNLPPGTPMFRDVNNLSYRQDFTPQ